MVTYRDNLSKDEREQTPLEDYEDVAAYDCEGVFCGAKLGANKLEEINLLFIAEELGTAPFELDLSNGRQKIDFNECSSVIDLLSQIDGLSTFREILNSAPVSWVTDILLIEDGAQSDKVSRDIDILARALSALQEKAEKVSAT